MTPAPFALRQRGERSRHAVAPMDGYCANFFSRKNPGKAVFPHRAHIQKRGADCTMTGRTNTCVGVPHDLVEPIIVGPRFSAREVMRFAG